MRKIIYLLICLLLPLGALAQTYSKELVKKARRGDIHAMFDLGLCYYEGNGVTQDKTQTINWWHKAAKKGNTDAMVCLGLCYAEGEGVAQNQLEAINWYRKAADKGNASAMYYLGYYYEVGEGVTRDEAQAMHWYRLAAENGNANAMSYLGICYCIGKGVAKDNTQAVYWLRQAAEKGNDEAMYYLGNCYYNGEGVARDATQSMHWYRQAAERGNAYAMNNLGNGYYYGDGITQDYAQAVYWYRQAAERGNAFAMNSIGNRYFYGQGITQDYTQAVYWYRQGAEKENADAMENLGNCYYYGKGLSKDDAQAVYWYRRAAELGLTDAMNNLGNRYFFGEGVAQDYSQSVYWYRQAAEQGNDFAMCNMGNAYFNGKGVASDKAQSVYWYRQAAERGNAFAMTCLGHAYYYGRGVARDDAQAVYWYRQGAEKGDTYAMTCLGRCYNNGEGISPDKSQAIYWWHKAAREGDKEAIQHLAVCYRDGTGVTKSRTKANLLWAAKAAADKKDDRRVYELVTQALGDLPVPQTAPKDFPILQWVPNTISFADATGNQAIDANEACQITFQVRNTGKGAAVNCVAKLQTQAPGISAIPQPLPTIGAGQTCTVKIPVNGNMSVIEGTADLSLSVDEPNGFGCTPTLLTVATHAFKTPMLKITDYAISNQSGNTLRKMEPFELQLLLQNTDYGQAEQVEVSVELPQGIFLMDGQLRQSIPSLSAGKQKELRYTLIANNQYAAGTIPVKVNLHERYGKYAESCTITLTLNQEMSANRIIVDDIDETPHSQIAIAQIKGKQTLSDVDQNIPEINVRNENTFAVIIANENYQREAKVAYAHNDGKMVSTYFQKVLGIPSRNIHLVNDATLNNLLGEIEWLQQVSEAYQDEARIIFYYAGHGVPDEQMQKAYLLPVDGYGTNLRTGYPLERLYAGLSKCPSRSTLVFMDACFSGSQRTGEKMESARAVGIRTKACTPAGNMVVFSAAQGNETAYPCKGQSHGLFTYFLLKKLKETRGEVTLGELGDYLITHVRRASVVDYAKSQTPSVQPSRSLQDRWKKMMLGK